MQSLRTLILLSSFIFIFGFSQSSFNLNKEIRQLELDEEQYCLAHNLYFETSGEPRAGKIAVIFVVLNRTGDKRWPNNVCEVIWQKKWAQKSKRYVSQFSWTTDGKSDTPKHLQEWYRCLLLAKSWRDGKLKNNIGKATHYHSKNVKPWWRKNFLKVASIGNHIFYK